MTQKNKRGAAVISNCGGSSQRLLLIREINKYFPIDVYGKCGNDSCAPGKGTTECFDLIAPKYSFYMAFENTICKDYVTEKLFRAVLYPWVPVVWGGGNYDRVAPKMSYIDAREYDGARALGQYLQLLTEDEAAYERFFEWKRNHAVSAPGTSFACDICEKLHVPGPRKVYDDLYGWWQIKSQCIVASRYRGLFKPGSQLYKDVRGLRDTR
jgi:hypothetical protein